MTSISGWPDCSEERTSTSPGTELDSSVSVSLLKRLSSETETLLSNSVPGLVDVRSSLQSGHPEIEVIYNRDRLAEYGLTLRNVADLVRNKVQGRVVTEFRQEDRLIDIVVRLREEDRLSLEELRRL